ncbi:MAG: Mu-like prophage major head subunit gpT family protein, partial [Rhodospirillaceae bacterium]
PRYLAAAPSYKEWSMPMSFNDFRPHKALRLGDFPALKEVTAESGEQKYGTISENREQISAKEFATGISVTRRALVNDDLGQLSDFTALIGQRVASDENAWMYTLLASNPALSDTYAVFHANHGNLAGSAAAISVTSIGLAMAAVRKQKSLDGIFLNLNPTILVCGPAIETVARQFTREITPTQTSNVNPWSNQFKLVVDANITGNEYYLFCDPNAAPVFKYGYVQGTGPVVRSEIDFDTRGLRIVVGLDFGYGAVDYRGAYKNAGA